VWTWTAIDAGTKLVASWCGGNRGEQQRVRDVYQAVPAADRPRVDRVLADIACAGLLETPAKRRAENYAGG
jgi:hypothetical protein